jgi:hypothetical protein
LILWLGREDSNLRMAESKSAALPLGYAPPQAGNRGRWTGHSGRRNIIADSSAINDYAHGFDLAILICRLPQARAANYNQSRAAKPDIRGPPSKLRLRKK